MCSLSNYALCYLLLLRPTYTVYHKKTDKLRSYYWSVCRLIPLLAPKFVEFFVGHPVANNKWLCGRNLCYAWTLNIFIQVFAMLLNQFKADPTIRDNSGQKASSFLQKCTSTCKVEHHLRTLILCLSHENLNDKKMVLLSGFWHFIATYHWQRTKIK